MVDGNNGGAPQRPTVVITLGPSGPEISCPPDLVLTLGMIELGKALIVQRALQPKKPALVLSGPLPGLHT